MIVLNVGGGCSDMPAKYAQHTVLKLDIDPGTNPDICADAKNMGTLEPRQFDAVYCSHMLEHFYIHDVPSVLKGMKHVLRVGGFIEVHVPDLLVLAKAMAQHEPDDVWYESRSGPITYHDVMYGHGGCIAAGNLFYAHKCGFSAKSLGNAVFSAGFNKVEVYQVDNGTNLMVYGIKEK